MQCWYKQLRFLYLLAAALALSCRNFAIVAAAGSFRLPDLLRLLVFVE
jgi:hypothetical protein